MYAWCTPSRLENYRLDIADYLRFSCEELRRLGLTHEEARLRQILAVCPASTWPLDRHFDTVVFPANLKTSVGCALGCFVNSKANFSGTFVETHLTHTAGSWRVFETNGDCFLSPCLVITPDGAKKSQYATPAAPQFLLTTYGRHVLSSHLKRKQEPLRLTEVVAGTSRAIDKGRHDWKLRQMKRHHDRCGNLCKGRKK